MTLIELWRAWRGNGAGAGALPFSGGAADQPAVVMEAFRLFDHVEAALKPPGKPGG